MATATQTNIHFDPPDLSHTHSGTYSALHFGRMSAASATVYFAAVEDIDAVIAELCALKAEMLAPAPGECPLCGHAHGIHRDDCPASPVITDSGRDCDQANPETGAWCHKSGPHKTHRDTDGETWVTNDRWQLTPAGEIEAAKPLRPYACCEHCEDQDCDAAGRGHLVPCGVCPDAPAAVTL